VKRKYLVLTLTHDVDSDTVLMLTHGVDTKDVVLTLTHHTNIHDSNIGIVMCYCLLFGTK